MKNEIIIFGLGEQAEIAYFYFNRDSDYEVIAFTVNESYVVGKEFCGLPIVPFENIEEKYPVTEYKMFIAVGYKQLNRVRALKYREAKQKGYELVSYISSKATVLNDDDFGDNCFILEDNTIQPFVKIGNNVILWSGNHIGHHSKVCDNCFITSHVVVSGRVIIKENTFIGVNSTVRDYLTIGEDVIIGAGSLVMKDVPAQGVLISPMTKPANFTSDQIKL